MKTRGFTLLEVLIALAILSIIVLATHQILNVTTNTQDASEQTLAELTGLQTTFRFMEQDFSQIVPRTVRDESGDNQEQHLLHERYLFNSEYDGIGFVRAGWFNPAYLLPRSELQAVGYRVVDKKLERIYRLYVDSLDNTEPLSQVLLDGVEELTFEFRGKEDKWLQQWEENHLPRAVAVIITLENDIQIKRLFLLAGQGSQDAKTQNNGNNGRSGGNSQGNSRDNSRDSNEGNNNSRQPSQPKGRRRG